MTGVDCELAALRAAVRRAGRSAEQFWLAVVVVLGLTLDALLLGPHVVDAINRTGIDGAMLGAAYMFIFPGPACFALAVLPALILARLYRASCAAWLRRQLAPLSDEQRERVLQPLEDDALPEAREIARLLLRDCRAAEVSPAPPLGAERGTEPSA